MITGEEKEKAMINLEKSIFAELSESLKTELLVNCENVKNGAKLAAYIPFREQGKIITTKIIGVISKNGLKYMFVDFPDKKSAKEGWQGVYIYSHKDTANVINEIEKLDIDSKLYHFAFGKIFGYNDYEVMRFVSTY